MALGKSFLFVFRKRACGSFKSRELLDMALTAAAFDQPVSILFVDDGVFEITRSGQLNHEGGGIDPMFEALGLYDVRAVWVDRDSLAERNLVPDQLAIPVELLDRSETGRLMAEHDVVVNV